MSPRRSVHRRLRWACGSCCVRWCRVRRVGSLREDVRAHPVGGAVTKRSSEHPAGTACRPSRITRPATRSDSGQRSRPNPSSASRAAASMLVGASHPRIVRVVEGLRGAVAMSLLLKPPLLARRRACARQAGDGPANPIALRQCRSTICMTLEAGLPTSDFGARDRRAPAWTNLGGASGSTA